VTYLVGWRAVFWVYVAVAVLLAAAIRRSVPRDQSADASVRLSVPSVTAFTTAVMAFVVATTLLPQPGRAALGGALLAVAVVLAGVFIAVDRRSAAPLLPRTVLGLRLLRQGAAGGLLNTLTTSSAITLVTLYLQNTLGHSPLVAGLMLLPFSVAVIAGSALAAPALARWASQRLVSTGLAVIAVSDAALIPAASSTWALPVCVAAGGAGIGLSSVAATRLGTSVPIAVRGTASGIINTAAQLGTAVGIAALLLLATLTTGIPEPGSPAPAIAWGAAALIAGTGAVIFGLKSPGHATSFQPAAAHSEARAASSGPGSGPPITGS
jgi:predicted MFS family arabinose efflux permease